MQNLAAIYADMMHCLSLSNKYSKRQKHSSNSNYSTNKRKMLASIVAIIVLVASILIWRFSKLKSIVHSEAETTIKAPIAVVWNLLDGEDQFKRVMPNVLENKAVKITPNKIGSIYHQKYKEGSQVMDYDVETIDYRNEDKYKALGIHFTLCNMFDITCKYDITSIDSNTTKFRYVVDNKAMKWYVKLMLAMGDNTKVVNNFMKTVTETAESDYQNQTK